MVAARVADVAVMVVGSSRTVDLLFVRNVANVINNDIIVSMDTKKADLLLHPVRLRLVMAMSGAELTTTELAARLPDVAPATLYRHVARLHEGGILTVVGERRVRGGIERTYRIVDGAAHLGAADARRMSRDEHLTGFVTFVGTLIDAMGRYLDEPDSRPGDDPMGYRQVPLWLAPDELEAMAGELAAVLERYSANEPRPERTRTTLSTILIPEPAARG